MLSEAIEELEKTYSEYEATGLELAPQSVEHFVKIFQIWAMEARNLEERVRGLKGRHRPIMRKDIESGKITILKRQKAFSPSDDAEGGTA